VALELFDSTMAKQIMTDGEFTLRRQARRRLIGAIALMLGVVIFLPMIFDPDPASTAVGDIELRIPERTEVAPVPQAAQEGAPKVELAVPDEKPVPVEFPVETAIAPVTAPPAKIETTVKRETYVPPAPAKVPGKPSGWVVQVGAYSKEEAAKQMVDNLKKRGYPVYTERAGSMLRVRVGHYPDRKAAEKTLRKLEAIGLHPNVLSPE